MSKSRICGLLTVVALVCGCDKGTKKVIVEGKAVDSQSNIVKLETSMGNIVIELDRQAAPVTAKNFLEYVEAGFYDGTIFHRVIPNFMIQGGGFTADLKRKNTRSPIVNEAWNGPSNTRGTIAMARTNDPDSATSQFFINHIDNAPLNYVDSAHPGYAVFGKVTEGMDVVDAIAAVKTTTRNGMQDVPVEPVIVKSARVVPQ
ncbi:MAG TPA: peptidylprolyl isomerase [Sedimentisphaerales bacterium]|nr:peptidylprolyl isomerase [Sedimentisphaerales bacterium]